MTDCVKTYSTRTWKMYALSPGNAEYESLRYDSEHDSVICHSESDRAVRIADTTKRFYLDLELRAAGLDPSLAAHVARLTSDWKGHRRGSMVMCVTVILQPGECNGTPAWCQVRPVVAVET